MGRSLLAGLVFLAIFLAGAVAGGFLGLRWAKPPHEADKDDHPAIVAPFGPKDMRRFAEGLQLTPDQRMQIRRIIVQYAEDTRVLRRENEEAAGRLESEVKKVLTPEQCAKFDELRAERRFRLQEQRERVRRYLTEHPRDDEAAPAQPDAAPAH
jgi:Spy/CpxP family protein refolding chaperone